MGQLSGRLVKLVVSVLSDKEKRDRYDQFGDEDVGEPCDDCGFFVVIGCDSGG